MRTAIFSLSLSALCVLPLAGHAEPSTLTADQEKMVIDGFAPQMLDPTSILLRDVIVSADPETADIAWVCGKIQGKNSFGGYAQPRSFIGAFGPTESGALMFMPVTIAEPTEKSELLVLQTCLERFK